MFVKELEGESYDIIFLEEIVGVSMSNQLGIKTEEFDKKGFLLLFLEMQRLFSN